jgi:NitT/TauT family transport system substrate-binding protein
MEAHGVDDDRAAGASTVPAGAADDTREDRMTAALTLLALMLAVALGPVAGAQTRTSVTVFEAWYIHNESMGTPTALERGLFDGIDVKVVGGGPERSPIDRVMAARKAGGVALGVDHPYNILEARARRKVPVVVVAHDFQKSALRLVSWKELKSARDVEGTVGTWTGYDKPIKAAIGPDWASRITIVNQQGDPSTIGAWLRKEYPFAHAMVYNELLVAERSARQKFFSYSFPELGIDWPENVVFTTEEALRKYPAAIKAFVTGRYRGYRHALANRDEAVQILVKYNGRLKGQERQELRGMSAIASVMATPETRTRGLGYVDPAAWQRVARDLTKAGFYTAPPDVRAAYSTAFPSGVTP